MTENSVISWMNCKAICSLYHFQNYKLSMFGKSHKQILMSINSVNSLLRRVSYVISYFLFILPLSFLMFHLIHISKVVLKIWYSCMDPVNNIFRIHFQNTSIYYSASKWQRHHSTIHYNNDKTYIFSTHLFLAPVQRRCEKKIYLYTR